VRSWAGYSTQSTTAPSSIVRTKIDTPADFVGAGLMPAFKYQQKFVLVVERGHKARAY
jgi:hypothetical protein